MAGSVGEFITGLRWEDLPPMVQDQVKTCLLDHLGAGLAGSQTLAGQAARCFAGALGAPGLRGVPLSVKAGLLGAVFANAVAASELDIDDGHRGAMGHPGAGVFPAALAAAEMAGAGGKDFLTAAVIGYEVALKEGERLFLESREWSFASGTWVCLGAAAASARLLGLSPAQAEEAVGIAAGHTPLAPVQNIIQDAPTIKESIGWAAVTGVGSALLAREGFTGIKRDWGNRWGKVFRIQQVYFKQYPSCRWSHPVLDAVLFLQQEKELAPDQIRKVEVYTFRQALKMANYHPKTSCQAQYSLPFPVGAALARGKFTPEELEPENLTAPDILSLARRVHLHFDPEREGDFPQKCTARVVVEKENGSRIDAGVYQTRGDWNNPYSKKEMEGKFIGLTEKILTPGEQKRIMSLVETMETREPAQLLT